MSKRWAVNALLLFVVGCGGERVSLDGRGVACVSPTNSFPEGGKQFEAEAPLYAFVTLRECLSSSCDTERDARCTVDIEGDAIVIESEGGYTDESGLGRSCTSDCGVLMATCQTAGPVPAGEYVLVYGGEELSLTVPSLTGAYCVPAS